VALAILRGVIDFKREPWPQISDSAKSLVRHMLEPDPKKRLTAEEVLGKYFMVCEARWECLDCSKFPCTLFFCFCLLRVFSFSCGPFVPLPSPKRK